MRHPTWREVCSRVSLAHSLRYNYSRYSTQSVSLRCSLHSNGGGFAATVDISQLCTKELLQRQRLQALQQQRDSFQAAIDEVGRHLPGCHWLPIVTSYFPVGTASLRCCRKHFWRPAGSTHSGQPCRDGAEGKSCGDSGACWCLRRSGTIGIYGDYGKNGSYYNGFI